MIMVELLVYGLVAFAGAILGLGLFWFFASKFLFARPEPVRSTDTVNLIGEDIPLNLPSSKCASSENQPIGFETDSGEQFIVDSTVDLDIWAKIPEGKRLYQDDFLE
jgi:hypothetical protein